MQTYVRKQNWEKFHAIDFHISVTKRPRKHTAFASKLLQTQTYFNLLTSIANQNFHISVTQCQRKHIAFASKLLQTQTKSLTFTKCNLQQIALYYNLWLLDW